MNKKQEQLGMNPSTAQHRLLKDILWDLVVKANLDTCCKCGNKMCRNTFSIEHIVPWLDSENPVDLFFNLNNIAFSHLLCNIADRRNPQKWDDREAYELYRKQKSTNLAKARYNPEKRKVDT